MTSPTHGCTARCCLVALAALALAATAEPAALHLTHLVPKRGLEVVEGRPLVLTMQLENRGEQPLALLRAGGAGQLDRPVELVEEFDGRIAYVADADLYELDPQQRGLSRARAGILLPGERASLAVPVWVPVAAAPGAPVTVEVRAVAQSVAMQGAARVYMNAEEPARTEVWRWLPITAQALENQKRYPVFSRVFLLPPPGAGGETKPEEELVANCAVVLQPAATAKVPAAARAAAQESAVLCSLHLDAWLVAAPAGWNEPPHTLARRAGAEPPAPPAGWSFAALWFVESQGAAPSTVGAGLLTPLFGPLLMPGESGHGDLALLYADDRAAFAAVVAEHGLAVGLDQEGEAWSLRVTR